MKCSQRARRSLLGLGSALLLAVFLTIGCGPTAVPNPPPVPSFPETTYDTLPDGEDIFLSVDGSADDAKEVARIVDQRLQDADLGVACVDLDDPLSVQVRVTRPDPERVERARKLATRPGSLEFRILARSTDSETEAQKREQEGPSYRPADPTHVWFEHMEPGRDPELVIVPERSPEIADEAERSKVIAENVFRDSDLHKTGVVLDQRGESVVSFEFVLERKDAFTKFTDRNLKRQLAIILDGRVHSAPVIQSRLPGGGVISGGGMGGYSQAEAEELALVLQHRALPVPVSVRSLDDVPLEDE